MSSLLRALDRLWDRFSFRPLSLAVFVASIGLLVYLQTSSLGHFQARAVAQARQVVHPARVASFVTRVYVRPGDQVETGAPLVDLAPDFIDREIEQLDLEIEGMLRESRLAQARLLVDEERWLSPEVRLRPDAPSLEQPTRDMYASRLRLLQARRALLREDRKQLTIVGLIDGRVLSVIPPGSAVAVGAAVATLVPEYAEEVVAYVPPDTHPGSIAPGVRVVLARDTTVCAKPGAVLRRGAGVEEAPEQLSNLFRLPVHGLPVYVSVPEGCAFSVGQVLSVEFPKVGM